MLTAATQHPILQARETRWLERRALAQRYAAPVLTLCLNIPGPCKNLPGTDRAFAALLRSLHATLAAVPTPQPSVLWEQHGTTADGPYCHLVCALPTDVLKRCAVQVETQHPQGRLADADVMDAAGNAVSRTHLGIPPRTCFLCNELPAVCRRTLRHTPQDVLAFVHKLLTDNLPYP